MSASVPISAQHAITRAKDRYNLDLTLRDLIAVCKMIQQNAGEFIRKQDDGSTVWYLDYTGVRTRVVISADFYSVITFLPLHDKGEKYMARLRRKRVSKRRKKALYKRGEIHYEESQV